MIMHQVILVGVLASAPPAATPPAPPPPSAPPATTPPAATPPAAPPSLDEALGLEGRSSADAEERARAKALARSLQEQKPRDLLASAIEDMRRSNELLDRRDDGLITQRAQESVVRKLDELIAAAQRIRSQEQQSGQSSQQQSQRSSQGRQQQQQQQQGEQNAQSGQEQQQGQRPGQQRPQAGDRRDGGAEGRANEPPGALDPTTTDAQFDETRTEWGRLPARVRDAVRQGMRDPMSAAYRRLTQDYYRRMAEEPKR